LCTNSEPDLGQNIQDWDENTSSGAVVANFGDTLKEGGGG